MNKQLSFDSKELLRDYQNPDFAMAYGSGVFKQEGYKEDEKPMIDMVFGVRDTKDWHYTNKLINGDDYSTLMRFMPSFILERVQKAGAGIYYHPYVPRGDIEIKYGVISRQDIIDDLKNWKTLYVA